jgi:DNA-binding CsgD family transcriptional regulator
MPKMGLSVVNDARIFKGMPGDSSDNQDDHLPVVTQIQLECVRRAGTGADSKTIARQLGLSFNTVNVYISHVKKVLGAHSRYEAAEMIRQYDAGAELKRLKLKPRELEAAPGSVNLDDVITERVGMGNRSILREDRARFDHAIPLRSSDRPGIIRGWGSDNELSQSQRLKWILRAAGWVILATFLAFAAAQSLQTTLTRMGFTN